MNLLVFCSVGLCFTINMAMAQNDIDVIECEPSLADSCFRMVPQTLKCITGRDKGPQCSKKTVSDFCTDVDEALSCASDIIHSDCGEKQGRDRFDQWLKGLRAVYYSLCGKDNTGLLSLVANPTCWSPIGFLACTESKAGIDHVNDLLKTRLDLNECNRLLVSVSMCNVMATSTSSPRCTPLVDVVGEIIHTFFTATGCGQASTCLSSSAAPKGFSATLAVLLVISTLHCLLKYLINVL